jgi:hypothetical protein
MDGAMDEAVEVVELLAIDETWFGEKALTDEVANTSDKRIDGVNFIIG